MYFIDKYIKLINRIYLQTFFKSVYFEQQLFSFRRFLNLLANLKIKIFTLSSNKKLVSCSKISTYISSLSSLTSNAKSFWDCSWISLEVLVWSTYCWRGFSSYSWGAVQGILGLWLNTLVVICELFSRILVFSLLVFGHPPHSFSEFHCICLNRLFQNV